MNVSDRSKGSVTNLDDGLFRPQLIADLSQIGLLVPDVAEGRQVLKIVDKDLQLFFPLLRSFEVRLVPLARENCPIQFCTGILKSPENPVQTRKNYEGSIPAGGQGRTSVSAAFGCLGELAERLSLCSLGTSDSRIQSLDPVQPEVGLGRILGLSEGQIGKIQRKFDWQSSRTNGGEVDWEGMSARRLIVHQLGDNKTAQIPSLGVLFNEFEAFAGIDLSFASSSGCAVWHSREGARSRALLELLERDAVSQAWYNRLGITSLKTEVQDDIISQSVAEYLHDRPRTTRLYAVATEFEIHVIVALSFDADGRNAAFGSSAGWDIGMAAESAIREMLQGEISLELMQRSFSATETVGHADIKPPRQLEYARQKSIFDDLPINEVCTAAESELSKTYSYDATLQSCLDRKIEIWEFDATRADLKIPCVKLMSPDLCSWEPRFGKKRLFNGVVDRGLRTAAATEAEFAERPFPF